jgi:hypothetical protein
MGLTARSLGRCASAALAGSAAVVALATVLGGCSTSGVDSSFTVFADPAKYLYYSCDQINAQLKHWGTREQELKLLMEKAEQGAGGAVVNLIAYKADYVAATEELKLLNRAAREKNCTTPGNWGSSTVIR